MKVKQLLFIFGLCFFPTFGNQLKNIAILPFTGQGMPKGILTHMASSLRKELSQSGKYQVIDKHEMEMILQNKGINLTYGCNDLSCAQTMGNALSVDYVTQSRVAKCDNTITVNFRIIAVKTKKCVFTIEEFSTSSLSTFITQIFPAITQQILEVQLKDRAYEISENFDLRPKIDTESKTIN